tara:strand:- start:17 stop:649 length:633 start_codon:yes stop_codon:yes gene_type:complete
LAKEDFNKGDIKNYDGDSVESLSFGNEESPLWYKLEERKKKWSETVTKLVFENLIKEIEKRLTYMTDKGGDWLEISFVYYENPDEEDEVEERLFFLITKWLAYNIKCKQGRRQNKVETYMDDRWFWILNKVGDEYTTFDEIEEKFEEKKWNFEDYCRRTNRFHYFKNRKWILKGGFDVKMPKPEGWRDFLDKGEYRMAVLIINWKGSLLT